MFVFLSSRNEERKNDFLFVNQKPKQGEENAGQTLKSFSLVVLLYSYYLNGCDHGFLHNVKTISFQGIITGLFTHHKNIAKFATLIDRLID